MWFESTLNIGNSLLNLSDGINEIWMLSFNNNKNGKYRILCKNSGNIILEKHYSNNLLHGEYRYYWDNGKIRFSGMFSNNKRIGIWINYDKNGEIIYKEEY